MDHGSIVPVHIQCSIQANNRGARGVPHLVELVLVINTPYPQHRQQNTQPGTTTHRHPSAFLCLDEAAAARFARCGLHHFILDLALVQGQPVVVEINPMLNWGWYANGVGQVLQAILVACS